MFSGVMFVGWTSVIDDLTTWHALSLHPYPCHPAASGQPSATHFNISIDITWVNVKWLINKFQCLSSWRLAFLNTLKLNIMILSSLISLRRPIEHIPSPEDLLSDTIGSLFPDDLQNQHGDDPDTIIVYKSAIYGDLEFRTADVNGEEERRKFAHYLWNAGVLMGELVGGRPTEPNTGDDGWTNGDWWVTSEEEKAWSVHNETVLELGAGALG